MRQFSSLAFLLCLFVAFDSAQAQQQNSYYVFNDKTLEIAHDNPVHAVYGRWQVWLFQEGVHMPRFTANSAEAQDAYEYFLYHQQVGR